MTISTETKVKFYFRLAEFIDSFSDVAILDLKIFNTEISSFIY